MINQRLQPPDLVTHLKTGKKIWRRLRKHLALPITTISILLIATVIIFLAINNGRPQFKPITAYIAIVSHDHVKQIVPTNEPTVGALLKKLSITLNQGDVVEPSLATPITQDNFRINVYRAVPVEIVDGSQKVFTFSAQTTARSIAQQSGITLYPEDYVYLQPVTNFLVQPTLGEQVIIVPATPVNLNVYGTQSLVRTHATTVGGLLLAEHITLGQNDTVQPADSTPLTTNAQIFLIHHGTQLTTVQQTVPMPVQTIQDDSLTFGTSAIRQQGSSGMELLTYQQNLDNGIVVSQTLIQTVVTQQPVAEIIAKGQAVQIPSDITSVMAEAGIAVSDFPYVNYIVSNESGWCPTKVQGDIGYCPGYAPSNPNVLNEGIGYGLGQATPGNKMAAFGGDWETNPVTQLKWATSYAYGRYGSWEAAYNHWQYYHNW
ncbi:MAG TPA: ubiquitin-like domain-containing protein [Candidatus Saccharimonadales bacterium]|jgi:uncharacterized protein YabE (DUF348 family)|nr:ubiquitin-like domain-containing protein [Candidatus Saccharimonadales bacterium]